MNESHLLGEADLYWLRRSFEVARRARDHGNEPHGAVLVDPQGNLLLEDENTILTTRDCTGHAETNLVRVASQRYEPDFLAYCTLYASTEPCVMCAGAILWSGVGRLVYALSSARLRDYLTGVAQAPPISCREVLIRFRPTVEVIGPVAELEDEALRNHIGRQAG
jgi:tRNA(Arg) A34 adenosine deaminase TadA